ncbi:MAG: biopolymer transporter ExbD [Bacteroidetes bacterium]|nr:biopolymer transporter ExbD [Bacteroidota bacterium]MBS1628436.1 biopolymer transporter ExbD [Bacteroidota bacterium]
MNLRNHLRESSGEEPNTDALNDILFILLFFFLIIATLANPNVIKLAIPKAKSDTKAKQTIVVSIDSLQHTYVGTHPVLQDSLLQEMRAALRENITDTPTVVINAHKQADAQSIVNVMKAARELRLRTVLAVEKEQ